MQPVKTLKLLWNRTGFLYQPRHAYRPQDYPELRTATKYKSQVDSGVFSGTEAGAVYEETGRRIDEVVRTGDTVLNFGCGYSWVDALAAQRHRDVQFYALDRSEEVRRLNDDSFDEPNLCPLAGEIIETLSRLSPHVLVTARTLVLLPESLVRRVFITARDSGVRNIVIVEQTGRSRETFRKLNFNDTSSLKSMWWRDGMWLHHYPGLLKDTGWKVDDQRLRRTDHPHWDFRLWSARASRQT